MKYTLGPRKAEILRSAMDGDWFRAHRADKPATVYQHCVMLAQRGYLRRDFPDIFRFQITDEGRAAVSRYDLSEAA